jgi:hypothetical protein
VADGAIILMPYVGAGMDPDMIYTFLNRVEVSAFYNYVLDIEQFFA